MCNKFLLRYTILYICQLKIIASDIGVINIFLQIDYLFKIKSNSF